MDIDIDTVEELAEIIIYQGKKKIKDWRDVPETEEDPDE